MLSRIKKMNKNKEIKESLVNKYKDIFVELEKRGQNADEFFAKFGGKDLLLQYVQDLEDDVADDPAEIFKNAYEDNDIRRCVRTIVNIVKRDLLGDKRGLRKSLYSEGNLLKNPLNYGFDETEYNKTRMIILSSINHLNEISKEDNQLISAENAKLYNNELIQLFRLYDSLYTNRIENEKKLNESGFLQLSLPQIIQSFLFFFQSQSILYRKKMLERCEKQEFTTDFESEIASERVWMNPEVNVSFNDSIEHLLDAMDTLFRYVFFLKGAEEKTAEEIRQVDFITPYNSSDYATLLTLSTLDEMFTRMEMFFRYSGWNIAPIKFSESEIGYGFYPPDEKPYKTHIAAELRRKKNIRIDMAYVFLKELENNPKVGEGSFAVDVLDSGNLPGEFFPEYLDVSRRLDLNDFESFHFENDYKLLESYAKPIIESTKKHTKPYYFTCRFNGMCVEEYLDAYVFIYTFSKICYCAAVERGAQKQFVPLISLEYLYKEFSLISGYDYEKAKKLIMCFIFDKEIARKKRYGDVFTRPLICVGSEMVFLSESLVGQMNLDRNIEILLEWNNVNLAPMGKELECKIINKLKNVPELAVNCNPIEFIAYDGKKVEFDFIALLDEFIIVMEMKSVLQPYDDDELYRRHKQISEGVEQVIRRTKIIQKDWVKFKENCSLSLPDEPYDENHIIKVVCSDIADFTGLEEKGVVLTDFATIINYFTNPYVMMIKQTPNSEKMIRKKVLWPNGKPTAKEFMSYLRNPDTMDSFMQLV